MPNSVFVAAAAGFIAGLAVPLTAFERERFAPLAAGYVAGTLARARRFGTRVLSAALEF